MRFFAGVPLHGAEGQVLGTLCGRPAAIVTFLDGMWIRRPSTANCGALGEALGASSAEVRAGNNEVPGLSGTPSLP